MEYFIIVPLQWSFQKHKNYLPYYNGSMRYFKKKYSVPRGDAWSLKNKSVSRGYAWSLPWLALNS